MLKRVKEMTTISQTPDKQIIKNSVKFLPENWRYYIAYPTISFTSSSECMDSLHIRCYSDLPTGNSHVASYRVNEKTTKDDVIIRSLNYGLPSCWMNQDPL